MNCETTLALLDDWLDDALNATQRDAVERHVSTCGTCRGAFEVQKRLANDLAVLGGAGDAIASGMAVPATRTMLRTAWNTPLRIAAAIVLAVGATWLAKDVLWPALDQGGKRVPQIADRGPDKPMRPMDEGPRVELASDKSQFAVEMKSDNPRIHIVWLYDSPAAEGGEPQEATSAPASST